MKHHLIRAAVMTALITTAVAQADEPGSTTVGATVFIDATHIDQSGTATSGAGTRGAATGTGVDVKRGYLILSHTFDETWSANLTTDFNYSASTGETQVFVKYAYVQAALANALVVRAGAAPLPWIPYVEGPYRFRFVERTLIDRLNFGTTSDWGLHAFGKAGDGLFNYAVAAFNGGGYKNPSRTSKVDFEGRISVIPIEGLTLAIGGYSGERGTEVSGAAFAPQHTAERFDAFAAYVRPTFRVGAEYFRANNWNRLALQAPPVASDRSDGYSAWASASIGRSFEAFARYDNAKPSKDLAPGLKDEYYHLGVDYKARSNVDIALAYKYEKVEGGTLATANGTIGGGRDGEYKEVGLWGLIAF
jgi:hypothetical protein